MADEVLQQGVRGITDLMVMPGLINLDFADVRSVMGEMGKAMMGTGEAVGDNRAIEAAEKAISNPLLDGVSMKGAKGVIISITGGEDMRLMEVDEAASHIKELVDPDANIIWGSAFNNDLGGKIRVSVVATGIEAESVSPAAAGQGLHLPDGRVRPPSAQPRPPPQRRPTRRAADRGVEDDDVPLDLAPDDDGDDELLLDSRRHPDQPGSGAPIAPPADEDMDRRRRGRGPDRERTEQPKAARESGTLFERMSNIARGAAKAQAEDEEAAELSAASRSTSRASSTGRTTSKRRPRAGVARVRSRIRPVWRRGCTARRYRPGRKLCASSAGAWRPR